MNKNVPWKTALYKIRNFNPLCNTYNYSIHTLVYLSAYLYRQKIVKGNFNINVQNILMQIVECMKVNVFIVLLCFFSDM